MKKTTILAAFTSLGLALAGSTHATTLDEAIATDYPYLDKLFKYFHHNPELSMQEVNTSNRLAREFSRLGYDVTRDIGKTVLVATLKNGDGPTLMIQILH